jgi:energy-coupling factor transporter ATP-binding protein EcfA2
MAPRVAAHDIWFTPIGAEEPILRGASLEIAPGEWVAILGTSGCGKSTLCQVLAGLIPSRIPGEFGGRVSARGDGLRVGMVFQDPENQLFAGTVEEEVAFGPSNLGMAEAEVRARVSFAMEAASVTALADHEIATLSMGQKQRVALASMLSVQPDLLILDEPASNVDETSAEAIFAAVGELQRSAGLSVVMVDHDVGRARRIADRVLRLEEGLLRPLREREDLEQPLPVMRSEGDAGEVLAKAESLIFFYEHGRPVLEGVDLALRSGEAVAVLGPNGCGKTTLAKHFIGLLRPASGRVMLLGDDTARVPTEILAAHVGYAWQNPDEALFARSVREELAFGPRNFGWPEQEVEVTVEHWLRTLGCFHLADREPLTLSFGEKRRISLAAALTTGPEVAILDEPTAALDRMHNLAVAQATVELKRQRKAVLVLTHDRHFADAVCERQFVVQSGTLRPAPGAPC